MHRNESRGSREEIAAFERELEAKQSLKTARIATSTNAQVVFGNDANGTFARAWAALAPSTRWAFTVGSGGVGFVSYVSMRLQQLGTPVNQFLFATKGAGALFYGAPDTVDQNSAGVIGMLPNDSSPTDFANTLQTFAPNAVMTILASGTAGDQTYQGTVYKGSDLLTILGITINANVYASDAPVTCNSNGTAVTAGNIYQSDSSGAVTIKSPAPGGGQTQNFALTS